MLADDEIYIAKTGQDVEALAVNRTITPNFAGRQMDWYNVYAKNGDTAIRFKLNGASQNLQEKHGGGSIWSTKLGNHSSFVLLPKETYYAANPDWYYIGEDGHGQLCLSNAEMRAQLVENLINIINEEPDAEVFMVSQEDSSDYCCNCATCQADVNAYGASGYWLKFVNMVADEVKSSLSNSSLPALSVRADRIKIGMFAYGFTETPPTGGIKANDNVVVYFSPVYSDVYHTLTDKTYNAKYKTIVEGWVATAKNIAVWLYGAPSYRMRLIDNYKMMAENLKILRDNGCFFVNYAGAFSSEGTPFYDLEVYLISHLLWDCDQDVNTLIDRFFANYYKEAAAPMRDYFNSILARCAELDEQYKNDGKLFKIVIPWWGSDSQTLADYQERYTQGYLSELSASLAQATSIVSEMEDGEAKDLLEKRVRVETLAVRFWEIALYNTFIADIDEAVDLWYNDAKELGLTYPTGDNNLETFYSQWKAGNYLFFLQK